MEHLAPEFFGEPAAREEPLVNLMSGAVVQDPFLALLRVEVRSHGAVHDHELATDTTGFPQERFSLVLEQVAVEVAREDTIANTRAAQGRGRGEASRRDEETGGAGCQAGSAR